MSKAILLILCLCLVPVAASALEGAYLTGEEMRTLEPAFEAFLLEMADMLEEKGLLSPAEREAWILYQLGDFIQNGGFGSITVSYASGAWGTASDPVTVRRFAVETEIGTLMLQTLGRYEEAYSSLPGVPLDVEVLDVKGEAVPCRFRWTASGGMFTIWDAMEGMLVQVGMTYTNEGIPFYWYEEPLEGTQEVLTLDVLGLEDDTPLATVRLTLRAGEGYWNAEGLE